MCKNCFQKIKNLKESIFDLQAELEFFFIFIFTSLNRKKFIIENERNKLINKNK